MSKLKGTLEVFYDIVSPYSYIAFTSLCQYEHRLGVKLDFKPAFNAMLLKMSNNVPVSSNIMKLKHSERDLPFVTSYWQMPYRNISNFNDRILKKKATPALRLLTAARRIDPQLQRSAMRVLYHRLFFNDKDIFTEADVHAALNDVDFSNRAKLYEQMNSKEVKDELAFHTNEAINYGAFGVPLIVLHQPEKEKLITFGSDRLPMLCSHLGVKFEGPLVDDCPIEDKRLRLLKKE
ncbi:Glutathione S-transferase kappa 1 [Aphelenchoides besseyi]|nr:Glutathione S-transferase kappa 1 [Aphelenchoides besseyi]KAI6199517.1 Glutathione S-transferase kappa 1 [Aphelenchoides besseyi]